jgi:hypothetical protein
MRRLVIGTLLLLLSSLSALSMAQVANHAVTQNAIIAALPTDVSAADASSDQIAFAAKTLAFAMQGDLETNLKQVMVSLGELTRAGKFPAAPRYGDKSPPHRFYTVVLNVAASNYHGLNVQDMIRLTAAMRSGIDFLNEAESNPITR